LGDTGDARAVDVLRRLARSGAALSAVSAVEALGQLPLAWRVDGLIDALAHPEPEVVKAALPVLAEETDPRALVHLGACLDHEAWDVRRIAADLLAQSGGPAAVGLLRAKLGTELEPLVKEALMRALSELESATGLRRGTSTPPPRRGSRPPR
jgi:HEAT repeat protein